MTASAARTAIFRLRSGPEAVPLAAYAISGVGASRPPPHAAPYQRDGIVTDTADQTPFDRLCPSAASSDTTGSFGLRIRRPQVRILQGPPPSQRLRPGGHLPAAKAALPEPHAILRPHRARVPVGARACSQATPIEARRHLRSPRGARVAQSNHAVPPRDDPRSQHRRVVFQVRARTGEESADRLPGGERR